MPTRRERKTMAVQRAAIEMVRGKARIVFERRRRESVSKNNGVFNPYPCPRPFFILSSFSSCITEISVRALRSWWKRDPVWFSCAATCRTDCASHPRKILPGNPPPLFRQRRNFSLFLFLFYHFIYPLKSISVLKKNRDKESLLSLYKSCLSVYIIILNCIYYARSYSTILITDLDYRKILLELGDLSTISSQIKNFQTLVQV